MKRQHREIEGLITLDNRTIGNIEIDFAVLLGLPVITYDVFAVVRTMRSPKYNIMKSAYSVVLSSALPAVKKFLNTETHSFDFEGFKDSLREDLVGAIRDVQILDLDLAYKSEIGTGIYKSGVSEEDVKQYYSNIALFDFHNKKDRDLYAEIFPEYVMPEITLPDWASQHTTYKLITSFGGRLGYES